MAVPGEQSFSREERGRVAWHVCLARVPDLAMIERPARDLQSYAPSLSPINSTEIRSPLVVLYMCLAGTIGSVACSALRSAP